MCGEGSRRIKQVMTSHVHHGHATDETEKDIRKWADELEQRIKDGVIDVNLKFCCLYDTEGYTVEKALKEARIQTFVEMLH